VWPEGMKQTFKTSHWRCRFMAKNKTATNSDIADLMAALDKAGIDFIKTEQLYDFDGQEMFSKAQGE
jgi:isocitrate dehydrogenase